MPQHPILTTVYNNSLLLMSERRHTMIEVPSSEFTFTIDSQSEVTPIPSFSSRDTNREGASALIPQNPGLLPVFGRLSLNDSTGSMHSPPTWSSDAWISSSSSSSNYAQQHNVSPIPIPRLRLGPTSHGNPQHETNGSISPTSTPATSHIPGAFPTWSTAKATTSTESVSPQNDEESGNDQESDTEAFTEAKSAGIREEPLPAAPIYTRRLQDGLKEVKCELTALADTMGLSELNQNHFSDLHDLYKRTRGLSLFEYPETRTVGFIGDSGVGMKFRWCL